MKCAVNCFRTHTQRTQILIPNYSNSRSSIKDSNQHSSAFSNIIISTFLFLSFKLFTIFNFRFQKEYLSILLYIICLLCCFECFNSSNINLYQLFFQVFAIKGILFDLNLYFEYNLKYILESSAVMFKSRFSQKISTE